MRFGHKVVAADWSDADNRWELTVDRGGERVQINCSFLFACSGYYNYDEGYTPEFAGRRTSRGTIVHPQHWPEDLDYAGKKIVVIGSGATAVTLIPALIDFGCGPRDDAAALAHLHRVAARCRPVRRADEQIAARRRRPTRRPGGRPSRSSTLQYQIASKFPNFFRKALRTMAERRLPEGYDFDKHFSPSYKPWDQRLCWRPTATCSRPSARAQADVVTDTIERFTENGIQLRSGEELDADIIVTATGLNMQLFGGARSSRNGETCPDRLMAYKGMMLTGLPNMAFTLATPMRHGR